MCEMKSLLKMTWMEAKLFLREPASAFFTLVFPLIMLFIFGFIYGNVPPPPGTDTQSAIDVLIPALSAMVIGTTGLMAITITMATYRETGILRRLGTTPVRPLVVLTAQVIVVFAMTGILTIWNVLANVDRKTPRDKDEAQLSWVACTPTAVVTIELYNPDFSTPTPTQDSGSKCVTRTRSS